MRPDQAIEPLVRFVRFIEFTDTCWLWQGKLQSNGYGQFSVGSRPAGTRRLVYAHRFAYETMVGPIPEGMTVDHLCRVRSCVYPDHMEPVTSRENVLRAPDAIPAKNLAKTHCPSGHEYTEANTYRYGTRRFCRICRRNEVADRRKRKRQLKASLSMEPN